jgi:hypothetical protein
LALVENQVLGVLNKQSVNFLQSRLAAVGRQIQGFTFAATVNKAPASYVGILGYMNLHWFMEAIAKPQVHFTPLLS